MPALALGKEVLCRVPGSGTRQRRDLYRVQGLGTRQRPSLPSARAGTRQRFFFLNLTAWAGSAVKCHFFCRVLHSTKRAFAECRPLPSAGHSVALGKATLCRVPPGPALGKEWLRRVPDFWHSANLRSPIVIVISQMEKRKSC